MRHLVALVVCTVGAIGGLVWPSATPAGAIQADVALAGAVRGMTISTPRGGRDWRPDAMVGTIAKVKALGSNWIAIHPYVGIDRNSRVGWRRRDGDLTEAPAWLTRPIAEAHRQGVKILIKPHLAHWRTGFSWRGEIKFDTDEAWAHLRR